MVDVVVKALFDYEFADVGDRWPVAKGDIGILRWRPHQRHPRFLEPLVVWDTDPKRRARKSILSSLAVVGLQTRNARVILTSQLR
jgi:hypothetical protein